MTEAALPVAIPFLAAPLLVGTGGLLPRPLRDALAAVSAGAVLVICAMLARETSKQPSAYWLGGWQPHGGVSVGISLSLDPLGAAAAGFAALLVLAALGYAVRYFDAVAGLFHALMLLFMAGMVGFCETGDLFNLVVFFELMSAVAYALTAYRIEERAPIQGAINFAITNSLGGFAMFVAVALLYARTGALNMAQIGAVLDHHSADPLVLVALALLLLGFLTKAAIVPLHFWLADAHAVAPIPVCVLFSGVMVELGIYATARVYWVIFAGALGPHVEALRAILVSAGTVTALLGAFMCFAQRHIKRLLAFSTISHVGLFLCGVGLLDPKALAGVFLFMAAHGLTKAALFMAAGVLLHRFATIDEYELHGRGRGLRALAMLFIVGALLLAALPPLAAFQAKALIEAGGSAVGYAWLPWLFAFVSAVTGAAVLRIAGRVFFGLGPAEGPEPGLARAAEERVDETRERRDHTPWPMIAVPSLLLIGTAVLGFIPGAVDWIRRGAGQFTQHRAYAAWVLHSAHVGAPVPAPDQLSATAILSGVLAVLGAVGLAAVGLFGRPWSANRLMFTVRGLHSGVINDYIAFWTLGAGALGAVCLVVLR